VTETNENIYHRNNQTRKKFIHFIRYDGNSELGIATNRSFFFGRGWDLGSVRFSGLPLVPRIKFEFVFYFIFFFFLDSGADSS